MECTDILNKHLHCRRGFYGWSVTGKAILIQRVVAFAGQQPVGTHDHPAGRNVFGDHRICSHCGPAADTDPAKNLCARTDIHTVFHPRGPTFEVAATQRHLMANDDLVANLSATVNDDSQWMWQENIFG